MISCLLEGIPDVMDPLPSSMPVHCSEVVEMISEYRVYVINGSIRSVCQYKGPEEMLDRSVLEEAVRVFSESKEAVSGCALDFAVMKKLDAPEDAKPVTGLIEVNDGYSLGWYEGLSGKDYTDLLIARWAELLIGKFGPKKV